MPNAIEHVDFHGQAAIRLTAPDGAQATVLEQGAHLVSWIPAGGRERLYLSPEAIYAPGTAVRGGVPIVFPQFSEMGPLPGHGFARTERWHLAQHSQGADYAMATFRLNQNAVTQALWPSAFTLDFTISISGERLDMELEVINDDTQPFSFTAALHTYLAVREVEEAQVEGLHGQDYWDKFTQKVQRETGTQLSIDQETERFYYDTRNALLLREPHRAMAVHSENLPDTVIWNPWVERSAKLKDLPNNGFRHMLCIEAAVIKDPIQLAPQASWWGRQTLICL